MEKAKGRWSRTERTLHHHGPPEKESLHTFQAESGFTAVMRKTGRSRRTPHHCTIRTPEGGTAEYVSPQGHRITAMWLHLTLKDAKETVQERVRELELARETQDNQGKETAA